MCSKECAREHRKPCCCLTSAMKVDTVLSEPAYPTLIAGKITRGQYPKVYLLVKPPMMKSMLQAIMLAAKVPNGNQGRM